MTEKPTTEIQYRFSRNGTYRYFAADEVSRALDDAELARLPLEFQWSQDFGKTWTLFGVFLNKPSPLQTSQPRLCPHCNQPINCEPLDNSLSVRGFRTWISDNQD